MNWMIKWLLAGVATISTVSASESENRQFLFGSFEVTAVQDASSTMRSQFFPKIPEEEFRKLAGSQQAPSSVNVFLLTHNGKIILFDAGNGGERGAMLRKLEQGGISPGKVDFILLTHMHGDHIGGLLDRSGKAVFPSALVYVSTSERDYWENNAHGTHGELARKVLQAYGDRVKMFRFGEEVLPGIKALDASGHTPGHTVFETDSVLIVGDLLHAAAIQIPRTEICAIYDMEPAKAVQARRRIYELAVTSSKPIAGMHLPWPGIGRIVRNMTGYVYLPAD